MLKGLQRSERVRGAKGIAALFDNGKSGFSHPLRYIYMVEEGDSDAPLSAAILVSVPKRNHRRANKRNLLKRRIREAYRLNKEMVVRPLPPGKTLKIAFIYISKEVEEFKTIEDAIRNILVKIAASS